MSSTKSSNRRTLRTGTSAIDLPFELWEMVLDDMSKHQLWKIRSLNRSVYSLAARAMYGTISLTPRSGMPGSVYDILERICDTTLQIAGLVHTIHLHSNFEAYNPRQSLVKRNASKGDLDTAILMNPHVKVLNLTIHCSMWVRLYASIAWEKFADTLVHLELQFFTSSVLRAIPQNVCCSSLRSFVLTCSAGPYRWNNAIHAPHLFDLGIEESQQKPDAFLIVSVFTALKSILPSNLLSLGLHSLSHPDSFWAFDPSFLHPNAFPLLKKLHVSSASIDRDPVMLPFLLSRVGMLESLSIAATRDSYSHQSQLRDLALSSNLQELFLTYNIFWKVFSLLPFGSGHGTRIIQGCTKLLRLNIGGHISARDAFHLMVELARGESRVEQLCLSVSQLNLRLFRTVLLLLPRIADLTLADVRRQPDSDFINHSTRMSFWAKPTESSPCTYRFVELGKAARRLGREVREAMTKELRKNIERVYQIESWDEQKKKAFFSSMKKALNSARGDETSDSHIEATARDHRRVTVQLIEGCLANQD